MLYFLYSCISACDVGNCKECSDGTATCTVCQDKFYLANDDDCSPCDENCDTCTTAPDQCTSCEDGHLLNAQSSICEGKIMTII